jgi:predicted ester cyclase
MSAADNVAVVRRWYDEMWNQWRLDVADEIAAPALSFRGSLGETLHGIPALAAYVLRVRAAFPDFHNRIDEVVAEGDKVVVRLTYTGTHRGPLFDFAPTGRRVAYAGVAIFRLRGGKIEDGWVLGDLAGLREQLAEGARC